MVASSYEARHRAQRATVDADQAELVALRLGTSTADSGVYDERVAGTLSIDEEEAFEDRVRWQRQDVAGDTAVGGIREEIERRIRLMGSAYPFDLNGGRLRYRPSTLGFYEFCLATSRAPNITIGELVHLPRDFERVAALLVKGYLGVHSEVLHTGAPRDGDVGVRFTDAMRTLHERSKEWRWDPEEGLPDEHRMSGDEGVDFIAWKRSLDGRPGQLFFLAQCACGGDWDTKFNDMNLPRFKKWFRPEVYPKPIRLFATPHHVADAMLVEAQRQAGLVLDRARLALIAETIAGDPEMAAWPPRLADRRALVVPSIAA